ncbi:glycosyltransferase [Microscilla marina]|uniref:Glycosyltransferase n=1 Tax=Microscilla marina ATCC 23134 TaxID=313606 RepID=A1ZCI4_MICM2|nr:hypothetical protein [Microscilla marina]EAY31986.1 conserved hypothetical protein [Microscilla marina ATCC 23134]
MKKKVFIGLTDIASQITDLAKGFEANGYETLTAIHGKHANIVKADADYDFSQMKKYWFGGVRPHLLQKKLQKKWLEPRDRVFRKAVRECDIFVFMWSTFMPDLSDLKELKRRGKKIIVFFVGSDVRKKDAYEQEAKLYNIQSYFSFLTNSEIQRANYENKLKYTRVFEKYADVILSLPNQSQLGLRAYQHFFVPVNTQEIVENSQQREIPIIAHAPSNRGVKGTSIILDTLNQLKDEGVKFEQRLIENMPYHQALKTYSSSDIIIGELFLPSGGKLDREALAAGAVSMTSLRKDYIDYTPDDCPIIDITPNTLYTKLKSIIQDYPKRQSLAKIGRAYVEKYHSPKSICKSTLDALGITDGRAPHIYTPTFFREKFIPESNEDSKMYNQWTEYVKDCDWYKKYVPSGERDGLIF